MVPPPIITFNITDSENENLIATKAITAANIKLTDTHGKDAQFFIESFDNNVRDLRVPVGIDNGERIFKLVIAQKDSVVFSAKVRDHNCGSSLTGSEIISSTLFYKKEFTDRYTLKY